MNFFNTLSSRLVGGLDTTSLSYINNLEVTTTLDMCGNDLIDLSNAVYGSKAYGINAYDANSSFLVVHNSSNNLPLKTSDFALNPFSGFSVYMKYKVRDNGLYTVFSQYAIDNPIVKLTSSHTEVEAGDTFEITVFQKGYADLSYAITGVTSAQLGGASLTGTVSDMYTVLPFTLQSSASGPIVFTADGKSVSVTITAPPPIADATNDWIGSSNQDDSQFTLANFISFVQSKGIAVSASTGTNAIDNWNAINSNHAFPNGDKNFRFWAVGFTTCWLDFTAPLSGTCELKYGSSYDQTRIYVNDFTNYIDRISGSNFTSKTHTFSVTQGDTIRLEEHLASVSYFYHIKFTP